MTAKPTPQIIRPGTTDSGPTYSYRGATIGSNAKGTVYSFTLKGFPHGPKGYWGGIGHIGEIVRVVDGWLDDGKLPVPYVTPKT